jgi:hypothetical protein
MAKPSFLRFLHVISKGPRSARFQALGGLVLIVGAGLWLIFEYLLPLLVPVLVAIVGFVLVRRSLRESRPSS